MHVYINYSNFTISNSDQEELEDQKMRRRKVFEDSIRKNRTTMSNWFKYAAYEDNMKEIERARSIYERAIDVDHRPGRKAFCSIEAFFELNILRIYFYILSI